MMRILFGVFLIFQLSLSAHAETVRCYPPDPEAGQDTWFGNTYYTGGMPTSDLLRVGGWGDVYKSLIRFRLDGTPQASEITQAAIYLHAFPSSGTPVDIQWFAPSVNWQESTANWANFGNPSAFFLGTTIAPPRSGWYAVNITGVVQAWRRGTTPYFNFGLLLAPAANNNRFDTFYSSDYIGDVSKRPTLCIWYNSTEQRIVLKWPLATPKPALPTPGGAFGDPWGPGIKYCTGQPMTHVGVDISNAIGNPVFAADDGLVKEILPASQTGGFASAIVLEHNHPSGNGAKYTTVYWHVNPSGVSVGDFVPKGMRIATIADISSSGHGSHLHFGLRLGAYNSLISSKGALPTGSCSQLPTAKENFVNTWNQNLVLFQ